MAGLNQTQVTRVSAMTRKTILISPENQVSMSCIISGNGLVKAGTPVTGNLQNRQTPFTVTNNPEDVVGIILHDVTVTEEKGQANSQVLIFGFVDVKKLDADVMSMLTSQMQESLKMIQFVAS